MNINQSFDNSYLGCQFSTLDDFFVPDFPTIECEEINSEPILEEIECLTENEKRKIEDQSITSFVLEKKNYGVLGNETVNLNVDQFCEVHKLMKTHPPQVSMISTFSGLERNFSFKVGIRGKNCSKFLGEQKSFNKNKHYNTITFPLLSAIYKTNIINDFARNKNIRKVVITNEEKFCIQKQVEAIKSYKKNIEKVWKKRDIISLFGTNSSQTDIGVQNRFRFYESARKMHLEIDKEFYDIFSRIPKIFKNARFGILLLEFIDETKKITFTNSQNYASTALIFKHFLYQENEEEFAKELKKKNIGYLMKLSYHFHKIQNFLVPNKDTIEEELLSILNENKSCKSLMNVVE